MKRYKGILVLVLCMSIFALSGCGKGDDDSENTENEAVDVSDINVEVAYPTVRTISQSGSYIGTVETGEKVSVTPHINVFKSIYTSIKSAPDHDAAAAIAVMDCLVVSG